MHFLPHKALSKPCFLFYILHSVHPCYFQSLSSVSQNNHHLLFFVRKLKKKTIAGCLLSVAPLTRCAVNLWLMRGKTCHHLRDHFRKATVKLIFFVCLSVCCSFVFLEVQLRTTRGSLQALQNFMKNMTL